MNLTYEVTETGYKILNNGIIWIVQDQYIPFPGATIEEAALNHIGQITKDAKEVSNEVSDIDLLKLQTAKALLSLVEAGLM